MKERSRLVLAKYSMPRRNTDTTDGFVFQAGKASPQMIDMATETASSQGWRRPLLAWLKVQAMRAEKAGDAAETQRLQRQIALVEANR